MIDFQRMVRGFLLGGAGLWVAAMPLHASLIWAFAEGSQTIGEGTYPNSSAMYSSNSQFPPAGESYTYGDASGVATFSPNMLNLNQYQGTVSLSADTGYGYTSADMSTGTTHVLDSSESASQSPTAYVNVQSFVEEEDTLTFTVAGGGSATVAVTFTLDGGESPGPPDWTAWSDSIDFNFGASTFGYEGSWNTPAYSEQGTGGWNTDTFNNISATGVNFTGTFTVTNGEQLNYGFLQMLECNNGDTCDFANTSQIGLSLPSGVTYTSASGVFLANQAVPEPSSILLVGFGIAGFGLLFRRFGRGAIRNRRLAR